MWDGNEGRDMEELLAVMAVAGAIFHCSFGTFRAFVARRSSWLGGPYLAWLLRDAAAVNGRKRGLPSPLSHRNPAGGRPERGRAGCRTHTVRMQNAECRPSTKRTLAGRTWIVLWRSTVDQMTELAPRGRLLNR